MTTIIVNGKRRKVTKVQRNLYVSYRILYGLSLIAILLFLSWVTLSYFNVVSNNLSADTVKNVWNWNFFRVIADIGEKIVR